ncbi:MAG TPA: TauD/TfdA family dioxygenase, partial [Kofleriaceae bacterium]
LRLFESFHFDRRTGQGTVEKPVFSRRGDQLCASYLRAYIDAGHAQPGAPALDDEGRAALDCLDAVLDRHDAVVAQILLARGEVLLCNNTALLHARSEFTDAGDPRTARLLLRTWIRA